MPVRHATLARKVRIPPHTIQVIECDLGRDMSDLILEPASIFPLDIEASWTYNSAGTNAMLCVWNIMDRSYIINTGTKVGKATSPSSVMISTYAAWLLTENLVLY